MDGLLQGGSLVGQMPTRFPALLQFDLLEAPPIKQLAEDEATAPLHQLLMLVINGDVKVTRLVCQPAVRWGDPAHPGVSRSRLTVLASGMLGEVTSALTHQSKGAALHRGDALLHCL